MRAVYTAKRIYSTSALPPNVLLDLLHGELEPPVQGVDIAESEPSPLAVEAIRRSLEPFRRRLHVYDRARLWLVARTRESPDDGCIQVVVNLADLPSKNQKDIQRQRIEPARIGMDFAKRRDDRGRANQGRNAGSHATVSNFPSANTIL